MDHHGSRGHNPGRGGTVKAGHGHGESIALEGINVQGVITRRGNGIIGLFSNDRIGRSVMNEFTADVSGRAVPDSAERMATSLTKAYTFALFLYTCLTAPSYVVVMVVKVRPPLETT